MHIQTKIAKAPSRVPSKLLLASFPLRFVAKSIAEKWNLIWIHSTSIHFLSPLPRSSSSSIGLSPDSQRPHRMAPPNVPSSTSSAVIKEPHQNPDSSQPVHHLRKGGLPPSPPPSSKLSRPPRTVSKKWPPPFPNNNKKALAGNASSLSSQNHSATEDGGSSSNYSSLGNSSTPPPSPPPPSSLNPFRTTPSSMVVVQQSPSLTRDLSDLSGSYRHGHFTNGQPPATEEADDDDGHEQPHLIQNNTCHHPVPQNVVTTTTTDQVYHHHSWRQSYILSSRQPLHPQPFSEGDDSVGILRKTTMATTTVVPIQQHQHHKHYPAVAAAVAVVHDEEKEEEGVEVLDRGVMEEAGATMRRAPTKTAAATATAQSHISLITASTTSVAAYSSSLLNQDYKHVHASRLPLMILLMDPSRKSYEILQLWVDAKNDSVRDVLHSLQQYLAKSTWKQDYDGMFHMRNFHLDQLIHILPIQKYDIQSHEVWIAKPWAMSAKATISYASTLLHHLKNINVLCVTPVMEKKTMATTTTTNQRTAGGGSITSSNSTIKALNDTMVILSKEAQKRIYVPDGILKHHHAMQALSFSPSLEPMYPVHIDVAASDHHHDHSSIDNDDGTTSQLSESNCGTTSLGSVSEDKGLDDDDDDDDDDFRHQGLAPSTSAAELEASFLQHPHQQSTRPPYSTTTATTTTPRSSPFVYGGGRKVADNEKTVSLNRTRSTVTLKHANYDRTADSQDDGGSNDDDDGDDHDFLNVSSWRSRRRRRKCLCPALLQKLQCISSSRRHGGKSSSPREFSETLGSCDDAVWWHEEKQQQQQTEDFDQQSCDPSMDARRPLLLRNNRRVKQPSSDWGMADF